MMPVTPAPVVMRSVIGIRPIVGSVVTVPVRRPADAEMNSGAFEVKSLSQGRARSRKNDRADESKREHGFCYDPHQTVLRFPASVPRRTTLINARRTGRVP